jgi:biopolymer transport protein TolR
MAVSLTASKSAHRRRWRRGGYKPMSDINVTPFVDVMLVLLIVFMVTAPLLTVGIPVNLPKTQAEALHNPVEPLVVTVDPKGRVFLQETPVDLESLAPRLMAITQNKTDTRVFVRGDRDIAYGRIMEVMGRLTGAGFTEVALIAELPETGVAAPAPETEGAE